MTTESLVLEMKAKADQLKSELDAVNKKIKNTEESTKEYRNQNEKTEKGMSDFAGTAKKAGAVIAQVSAAVVAGTTALVTYAAAQGRAMQETQAMATAAGMTVEKFKSMSFALSTVGLSAEKFGDITKDTQERIGEFVTAGSGPFQDFIETMGMTREEGVKLAKEFQTLSGQEVLQEMVTRMEDADKSAQQMSFALESMASDTTRLIPLLQNGGKAFDELTSKADQFNVELSEEEKQQFKDLAGNVDLAQTAFVNWINNGIAPFLPLINEAGLALAEFFASSQASSDLTDITNNPALIEQIDTLTQLGHLEKALAERREKYSEQVMLNQVGEASVAQDWFETENERINLLTEAINGQRQAIEAKNAEAIKAAEIKKGELKAETGGTVDTGTSGGTGADITRIREELEAYEDSKKTKMELLLQEEAEKLAIIEQGISDEEERNALKLEIERAYLEQRQALIKEMSPETFDNEIVQERYDAELEQLQEHLNNKLITEEDYFNKVNDLKKKSSEEDKKTTEKVVKWEGTATKKQIDQGIQLLDAVGGNSKKLFKVKQGLSAANAVMNTAEGVTDALAQQNYPSAAIIAATGAAQLSAIMSAKPEGGGGGATISPSAPSVPTPSATVEDNGSSIVTLDDVSQSTTQRMVLEFNDDIIDVIARKVDQSKQDGRI